MQKTYDDCYLICSTAIYFENQVETRDDQYIISMNLICVRIMRQRLCARGGLHSTRSCIIMPTGSHIIIDPSRRQREPFRNPYET